MLSCPSALPPSRPGFALPACWMAVNVPPPAPDVPLPPPPPPPASPPGISDPLPPHIIDPTPPVIIDPPLPGQAPVSDPWTPGATLRMRLH